MKRSSVCGLILAMVGTAASALAQVSAPPKPAPPTPEAPRTSPGMGITATPIQEPPAPPPKVRGPWSDAPGTGEPVDLQIKWVVGEVEKYHFDLTSANSARMADDEKKRSSQLARQKGQVRRRVVAADATGVTLSFAFDRLYLQQAIGQKVKYYDSDFGDDPNRVNDLTPLVKACMERTITVKLDPKGEVVKISGNEDPPSLMTDPAQQKPRVSDSILADAMISKLWRPMFRFEAPAGARVGEKWTTRDEHSDPGLGNFGISIHNELTGVQDGVATIESYAEIKHTAPAGAELKPELKTSDVTGRYEWDTRKGTLMLWETEQSTRVDGERMGARVVFETKVLTSFKRADVAARPAPTPATPPAPATPAASVPSATKP